MPSDPADSRGSLPGTALPRPRVGISSCLLGANTRYDGRPRRDDAIADELGRIFEYVSVCPEVGMGLPVPRPAVELYRFPEGIRMIMPSSGADYTERMSAFAVRALHDLAAQEISGFIFKARSPSCGLGDVNTFAPSGEPAEPGTGLFATALRERFPGLPIEDEGRLADPGTLAAFVARVFAYESDERGRP